MKRGFLLMNTGSPDSTSVADVRSYLGEFLMDPYVIDLPWLLRTLLVKGIILRTRPAQSAEAYAEIAALQRGRGRLDEAIRWYHEAYQRDSENTGAMFWTTLAYLRLSDGASARIWLERLRKAEKVPWLSDFVEARILYHDGDIAEATALQDTA